MAEAVGVWSKTSAQKDKLIELRGELGEDQPTLDCAAADDAERLDLYLADGLSAVVAAHEADHDHDLDHEATRDLIAWLERENDDDDAENATLDKASFEAWTTNVVRRVDAVLAADSSSSSSETTDSSLSRVRDFLERSTLGSDDDNNDDDEATTKIADDDDDEDRETTAASLRAFDACVSRYRLLLLRSAAEVLRSSWDELTAISDGDVDRAAVRGETLPEVDALRRDRLARVLLSYVSSKDDDDDDDDRTVCARSVDAWWDLVDRDDDGLLDQQELVVVADAVRRPIDRATTALLDAALDAASLAVDPASSSDAVKPRREKRAAARLRKTMADAVARTFPVEIEAPHRLRCSYAWAVKAHQDNKIDSVVVDTGATDAAGLLAGRKRYVELPPKMSLAEFRTEQREHFPHLDRVGVETLKGFKNGLLVQQGQGRQNRELRREVAGFLVVVTLIDAAVSFL